MSMFKKAVKSQSKIRLAIDGVSGSGKTYSSLAIASSFGKKIAVIDTERSAEKYASIFEFDCVNLENCSPINYIEAIRAACSEGYEVLVIDSLSHAWFGSGGIIELSAMEEKRQKTPNSYTAWRNVTPIQNKLIETIIRAPIHIVATLRVKTKYEIGKGENGKMTVQKFGLDPIQKDGMEYEFDVYGSMNLDNELVISKSRCPELNNQIFSKPGKEFAQILKDWITDGVEVTNPLASNEDIQIFRELLVEADAHKAYRVTSKLPQPLVFEELSEDIVKKAIKFLQSQNEEQS